MRVIKPSHEILSKPADLTLLETAGRTCYKSETGDVTEESASKFVSNLMSRQPPHESVIEHLSITVRFICDRGVSHELVRHRLAAFSQESTRYCNYSKDKFSNELTFIEPAGFDAWSEDARTTWSAAMLQSEHHYMCMLDTGLRPEQARSVLPNSLKTEIVMTANIREWRHVFALRTSQRAHPDMRALMCPLLSELQREFPEVF